MGSARDLSFRENLCSSLLRESARLPFRVRQGLEGNMQGEGLILGGVLVVSSAGDVVYTYLEETGSELPIADIGKANRLAQQGLGCIPQGWEVGWQHGMIEFE